MPCFKTGVETGMLFVDLGYGSLSEVINALKCLNKSSASDIKLTYHVLNLCSSHLWYADFLFRCYTCL